MTVLDCGSIDSIYSSLEHPRYVRHSKTKDPWYHSGKDS